MKPFLSLVIPAYNEEKRIADSLEKALIFLKSQSYTWEIIVSDDGSSDNTLDIVKQYSPAFAVGYKQNRGKGAAVRNGVLNANGDIIVFTDADFSTPIYEVEKIINKIQAGNDVCIGSRAVDDTMIKKHQPFYREFMGKSFNKIVQMLVIKGISDTQCGFKGFSAKSARRIFSKAKIDGFGFDVEILFLARREGFSICEVPVEWYNDERSKVDPVKDSIKMFLEIMKIKRLHSKD